MQNQLDIYNFNMFKTSLNLKVPIMPRVFQNRYSLGSPSTAIAKEAVSERGRTRYHYLDEAIVIALIANEMPAPFSSAFCISADRSRRRRVALAGLAEEGVTKTPDESWRRGEAARRERKKGATLARAGSLAIELEFPSR